MNIKIYQINHERDKNFVKFLHYDHLDSFQETKDINGRKRITNRKKRFYAVDVTTVKALFHFNKKNS